MKWCCLLCLYVLMVLHAKADVRLPAVLSSNMVLQQKSSVKLWGWADPSEKVFITTSWNHKMDSALTDGNAKWSMTIQTPSAGGPYTIHIKGHITPTRKRLAVFEPCIPYTGIFYILRGDQ